MSSMQDKIPGGLAAGQTLKSLQAKYPKMDMRAAILKGAKVEMEHTTDPQIAVEIAMDHLMEDPKYYNKLAEEVQIERSSDSMSISILDGSKEVGKIALEGAGDGKTYTIIDASINPESRGKGLYKLALLDTLRKNKDVVIVSVFRSTAAERAWSSLLAKLPPGFRSTRKTYPKENTVEYRLFKA
mgnify:FL=1